MLHRDLEERQSVLEVQTQRFWTLRLHTSVIICLDVSPQNTFASILKLVKVSHIKQMLPGKLSFVIDA